MSFNGDGFRKIGLPAELRPILFAGFEIAAMNFISRWNERIEKELISQMWLY